MWVPWVLFIGGVMFIWFGYISFHVPMFSVIFWLIALYFFLSMSKLKTIIVTDNSIEINPRIGESKKVLLESIESYVEIERPLSRYTENSESKELMIFTNRSRFSIYSLYYEDYKSLKEILTQGRKTNIDFEKRLKKREGNYLLFGVILMGVLIAMIHVFTQNNIECLLIGLSFIAYGVYTALYTHRMNP